MPILLAGFGCGLLVPLLMVWPVLAASQELPSTAELLSEARSLASAIDNSEDRWKAEVEIAGAEALYFDREKGAVDLLSLSKSAEYNFMLARPMSFFILLGDAVKLEHVARKAGENTMDATLANIVDPKTWGTFTKEYSPNLFEFADLFRSDHWRSHAFAQVGLSAATSGQLGDAFLALREVQTLGVPGSTNEVDLLCAIGQQQANSHPSDFRATLNEALARAENLPRTTKNDRPRDRALSRISATWAAIGYEKETFRTVRSIGDFHIRDWARLGAALAAAEGGHSVLAHKILESLTGKARGHPLNRLVTIHLALGDEVTALGLVPELSESCDDQSKAVAEIAQYYVDQGDYPSAFSLIDRIAVYSEPSVVSLKALALEDLAGAQAKAGRFEGAKQTAYLLPSMAIKNGPDIFECGVIRGHVSVPEGQKENYLSNTNRRIALSARARVSRVIAREMTVSGHLDEVTEWAQSEADIKARLAILLGAVSGLNPPLTKIPK